MDEKKNQLDSPGDALGDRMKKYENCWRSSFPDRLPVIVRLDGRSFHSFTKAHGFKKPFDDNFMEAMNKVCKFLIKEMEGAKIGYVQSDEISIMLYPWRSKNTQSWFGNNLQKIVSISAGMASMVFNCGMPWKFPGIFDCRAFVVPNAVEANNYFVWRQQDAKRNSVRSIGRVHFSDKKLEGMSNKTLIDELSKNKIEMNYHIDNIIGRTFVANESGSVLKIEGCEFSKEFIAKTIIEKIDLERTEKEMHRIKDSNQTSFKF